MNESSAFAALEHELKTRRKKDGDGGAGGAPKIKVHKKGKPVKVTVKKSQAVFVQRRPVSTRADKIKTVIISNWVRNDKKAAGRLQGALRYNQERERGRNEDERTFFTEREENLNRRDIRKDIRDKFGEDIAFHTVILSPGDNSINTKELTREIMAEWQEQLGYHLDYYAIEHKNTEHHHAHVIIPGSSIDKFSDIRFDREDLADLRELGNDYIGRERMIDRAFDRAVAREFGFDRQEQVDREFQKEFHMSPADYREDQRATELDTYSDYVKEWKDLGMEREYDLGDKNSQENIGDQLDADTRAINEAMMSDDDRRERDDDDDGDGRTR